MEKLTDNKIMALLNSKMKDAKDILNDDDKTERFLQDLERKLKLIPKVGDGLSDVPLLISLVRHTIKKDYKSFPTGSLIAIVASLVYFLSPVDFLPDIVPVIGYLDDIAVIAAAVKLVGSDLDDYKKWRVENNIIY